MNLIQRLLKPKRKRSISLASDCKAIFITNRGTHNIMQSLTTLELAAWIDNTARENPVLLDVREPWEFETCHIDGALIMPMNTIPDKLSELDKKQPIVCICHHGMRSMQVTLFLEQHGFTLISNLTGGMHAWAHQVDSTMPTY